MAKIITTMGQFFPTGEVIEVVRGTGFDHNLSLLVWDGKVSRVSCRVELNGQTYQPARFAASFLRAVQLPTGPKPYGSGPALVTDLATTIGKFSGLCDHFSRLIAFLIVWTWLFDCGSTAPRLSVVGPRSRGTDQLMILLGCFCRHAVHLSAVTAEGVLSLPFAFGLTLVIRQRKLSGRLEGLLEASTASQFVLWNGGFVHLFCPVVLHTERPLGESAACAGIEVPVWPSHQDISFLDPQTKERVAAEFQGKLLAFRLANLEMARKSRFDPAELTSPLREVARSLGACFSNDPKLQAEIVDRLRNADTHARLMRSTNEKAVLLEAMLFHCHERNGEQGGSIHVGEIADAMRVINNGRGESVSPSPRAVGEILRALGFETTKLDRDGRGVIMCGDIRERVHQLARDFGVPSMREDAPGCDTCKRVRKTSSGKQK